MRLQLAWGLLVAAATPLAAQQPAQLDTTALTTAQRAALRVASVRLTGDSIRVTVGDTLQISAAAFDAAGNPVTGARILYNVGGREAVLVGSDRLAATKPGRSEVRAFVIRPAPPGTRATMISATVPLVVTDMPVTSVEIRPAEGILYAGTTLQFVARALVAAGRESEDAELVWSTDRPRVATVDRFGQVTGIVAGTATLTVKAGNVSASHRLTVAANPIAQLQVSGSPDRARTGDVIRLRVEALNAQGRPVPGVVPAWTVSGVQTGDDLGARVWADGAFVAEEPGLYTVIATVGQRSARTTIKADPRAAGRPVKLVGRGLQTDHSTSEVHVWGKNGRDFAYLGTHAAGVRPNVTGNVVFVYDVTDPAKPVLTDSLMVNARVINDVLVNAEGTLGVLTREGAADRKNGLVVLDVADPAHPKILSEFTDSLTSGIHNTWFYQNMVYVTNDGTGALHIIDLSDPKAPKHAGRWETGDPNNRYLHDVWVHNGIMYLSYWNDGVQILDVGGLNRGGTAEKPVFVSKFAYPIGNTHNVWRDRNYLFIGDEIFGCPQCINGPRGYVHVVDLSDIEHPVEVGKFEVPEAGAHNMWAEDGKLYIAYYQGGLRIVDISGDLRGDLYRQGRQIGYFHTANDKGFTPNAPMAWGPQPYKGNIFISDMHSGL
ncbi:MAG: Ig-like domain-containing protein, partial [Acidimicrobiales bacterium]